VVRVLLGVVTTLAGQTTGAFADGTGAGASFNFLTGVAVIPSSGVIIVADRNNHRIRLVTPLGVVTTLAGSGQDFADGTGALARFNFPVGVAFIPSTNVIVVADNNNNRIRLVTYPGGVVTTLAGQLTGGFADGTGALAQFNQPQGVALLSDGKIVVADLSNNRIRIVDPTSGVVTTLAGQTTAGSVNGTGAAASFRDPAAVAVFPSSNLIVVADQGNHLIRLVTYPGGVVTTLAGSGTAAFANGTGTGASFYYPTGVAIDSLGNIIVADNNNVRIRSITYPGGVVTTLAGSGTAAFANGTGTGASFNYPTGVALNPLTGEIVVADSSNNRIRLIT
jgi:DNA-binding beta-propeller fold protein YncE